MIKKKAFLVGIKGVAMCALAVFLKEKGYLVSGSDTKEIFATDKILTQKKIKVLEGFDPNNISPDISVVIVTGAHGGMKNPEAQKALQFHIPTFMHGVFLGKLLDDMYGISVAGCHGKTTTSSIAASLLVNSGFDPSYLIGTAEIVDLGSAGHYGKGKIMVVEADEYKTCPLTDPTPRFLWQKPQIIIITNIEFDHPDAYRNIDDIKLSFITFTKNLGPNGIVIACIDDKNVQDILPFIKGKVISYGFSPQSDYRITQFSFESGLSFMRIAYHGREIGEFVLKIPGRHNLLNALAASIAVNSSGVSWDAIQKNIKGYTGCKRRFEKIAEMKSISLYDDYAHHPSEITATLSAAKKWFPQSRIITIFQPHTFSRTKALFKEFTHAFISADIAIIVDIYPSARESIDRSIHSTLLVKEANKIKKNVIYLPGEKEVLDFLEKAVKKNDLLITMGAGDIFSYHEKIISILKNHDI